MRPSAARSATASCCGSTWTGRPTRRPPPRSRERLALQPMTRGHARRRRLRGAHVALHGDYLHIRVATEADHDPSESPCWLDLIAAGNVVLSRGTRSPWRSCATSTTGSRPTPPSASSTPRRSLATAVDSAVTSYFKSVDEIEEVVDRLDAVALARRSRPGLLADLVEIRRRISRLRRVLSGQREVFAAFATPDFRTRGRRRRRGFAGVASRFESALRAWRTAATCCSARSRCS